MNIKQEKMGGWIQNFSDQVIVFPPTASQQGAELLLIWQRFFAKEDNWTQQNLGIPSLIVRLDCVVDANGRLQVYEVEERPSGIGVSFMQNADFKKRFLDVKRDWPEIIVVISPQRKAEDDSFWTKTQKGTSESTNNHLVLVRAEPEEEEFWHLAHKSVSSLKTKGDKSYGIPLGWWSIVQEGGLPLLKKGFVLKPCQGSKCRGIEIWDPDNRPGSSTMSKIIRKLDESVYCQQLIPPMETGIPDFRWMIYRVYYGYDIKARKWVCIGGEWNARSNLRIHGAQDSVFGPLVLEDK